MIPVKEARVLVAPEDLKSSHKKLEIVGTFNPGAARLKDGNVVLYVRVLERLKSLEDRSHFYSPRCEGKKNCEIIIDKFSKNLTESHSEMDFVFKDGTKRLTFISHLRKVILDKTGFKIKSIDKKPSFVGTTQDGELGIEDARITNIDGNYYMTYVALSRLGNISTHLASSRDALNWKRVGTMFREQNKDVVLFPGKVNGEYVAFNRPEGNFQFTPPKIWVSFSRDLKRWGNSKPLKFSKEGAWDYARIGAGPPPIKTEKGWLLIYHGVTEHTRKGGKRFSFMDKIFHKNPEKYSVYSVGAALFDIHNPTKIIAKSPHPIISPKKQYEKEGFVDNVVFPTGAIQSYDKKDLLIFSGGADSVTTVKRVALADVMKSLRKI